MPPPVVDDGGLQPERTILAWRRTALAAACVAVLSVRAWAHRPGPATLGTLVLTTVLLGTVVAPGLRRRTPGSEIRTRCFSTIFAVSVLTAGTSVWLLAA